LATKAPFPGNTGDGAFFFYLLEVQFQGMGMFCRWAGMLYWECPSCNAVHKSHVTVKTQHVKCGNCETRWIPCMTFRRKPRGPTTIPRDTLLIAEGFANRRTVNRSFCDGCGKTLHEDKATQSHPEELPESPEAPKPHAAIW